jgi:DNA (cytosine-5)-methyltransferase 1
MFRHLDLFSGIGGFSLGLESTGGFETVAFCEIEKFPRKVLKNHWPHVKQYKDIKELTNEQLETDGIIPIDIITGGYPCQPFSVAGSQRGEKDKRHLWPEMFRLVQECRPTWVIGENVSGHIKLGLDTVLEDLESEGYSTRAFSISASSVGANHKRERVWIVGHSQHDGSSSSTKPRSFKETSNDNQEGKNKAGELAGAGRSNGGEDVENTRRTLRQGSLFRTENENETGQEDADQFERSSSSSRSDVADTFSGDVETGRERQREIRERHTEERIPDNVASGNQVNESSNTNGSGLQGLGSEYELRESQEERSFGWERWWEFEPDVGRVANGVSKRMDKLKGLGNSLVPAIPFMIGNSILKTEENNECI